MTACCFPQYLKLQLCLLNPVRSESLDACFSSLTHLRCLTISNLWHGELCFQSVCVKHV